MYCQTMIRAVGVTLALGSAQLAHAQYGGFAPQQPTQAPFSTRPALSPYLNMLRGGDPAANYYLGVVPEYNNRYFQQQVRSDLALPARRQQPAYLDDGSELEVQIRQLPPTGHAAGFMIYNAYYNVQNPRGFIPYNPVMRGQAPQIQR